MGKKFNIAFNMESMKSPSTGTVIFHQFSSGVHQCGLCKKFLQEKLQESNFKNKDLAEEVFGSGLGFFFSDHLDFLF